MEIDGKDIVPFACLFYEFKSKLIVGSINLTCNIKQNVATKVEEI